MKEILDNKVTLNIVELCSELAHKRLIEYYKQFNVSKLEEDVIKICKNLFEQHIEFIFQQGASTAINNWSNKWGLSEDYKKEKEEFIKHFLNQL